MIRRRLPQYDPSIDPDLFYWFDASDQSTLKGASGAAITDGARVYEWLNKGSSPAKMIPVSGVGNAPFWRSGTFQGRPSVHYSGTTYLLGADDKTGLEGLGGITVVVACVQDRTPTQTNGGRVFCINNIAHENARLHVAAGPSFNVIVGGIRLSGTSPTVSVSVGTWSHNVPMILGGSFDYAGAKLHGYRDGIYRATADPFHDGGVTAWGTLRNICIGGEYGVTTAHWFLGHVFELMLWRRALTPQELVGPHHYLRTKWGIEPSPSSAGGMGLLSEPPPPDYGEGEGESADDLVTVHHYLRIAKGIG